MKKIVLSLIRFYQDAISPLKAPACRYAPSCSQYGLEAVAKHGVVKGGWLTAKRIARCNPLAKGGVDPVP